MTLNSHRCLPFLFYTLAEVQLCKCSVFPISHQWNLSLLPGLRFYLICITLRRQHVTCSFMKPLKGHVKDVLTHHLEGATHHYETLQHEGNRA